jgi:hypothetical protein
VTKRARGGEFPEPEDERESELDWDEVVDIICVGADPGPTAQAISGVQCGRRVLAVVRPQIWDTDTAGYIAEMTADFTPPKSRVPLPFSRAQPVEPEPARGRVIETFIGAHLREWAAHCWASPFGVLYTDPFSIDTTPMITDGGLRIEAAVVGTYRPDRPLADWLATQARDHDVQPDPGLVLQRLIIEYGRVAGAELTTPSGPLLVRALDGVALPTPAAETSAAQPDLGAIDLEVAIVGRPAGRFGHVELLGRVELGRVAEGE